MAVAMAVGGCGCGWLQTEDLERELKEAKTALAVVTQRLHVETAVLRAHAQAAQLKAILWEDAALDLTAITRPEELSLPLWHAVCGVCLQTVSASFVYRCSTSVHMPPRLTRPNVSQSAIHAFRGPAICYDCLMHAFAMRSTSHAFATNQLPCPFSNKCPATVPRCLMESLVDVSVRHGGVSSSRDLPLPKPMSDKTLFPANDKPLSLASPLMKIMHNVAAVVCSRMSQRLNLVQDPNSDTVLAYTFGVQCPRCSIYAAVVRDRPHLPLTSCVSCGVVYCTGCRKVVPDLDAACMMKMWTLFGPVFLGDRRPGDKSPDDQSPCDRSPGDTQPGPRRRSNISRDQHQPGDDKSDDKSGPDASSCHHGDHDEKSGKRCPLTVAQPGGDSKPGESGSAITTWQPWAGSKMQRGRLVRCRTPLSASLSAPLSAPSSSFDYVGFIMPNKPRSADNPDNLAQLYVLRTVTGKECSVLHDDQLSRCETRTFRLEDLNTDDFKPIRHLRAIPRDQGPWHRLMQYIDAYERKWPAKHCMYTSHRFTHLKEPQSMTFTNFHEMMTCLETIARHQTPTQSNSTSSAAASSSSSSSSSSSCSLLGKSDRENKDLCASVTEVAESVGLMTDYDRLSVCARVMYEYWFPVLWHSREFEPHRGCVDWRHLPRPVLRQKDLNRNDQPFTKVEIAAHVLTVEGTIRRAFPACPACGTVATMEERSPTRVTCPKAGCGATWCYCCCGQFFTSLAEYDLALSRILPTHPKKIAALWFWSTDATTGRGTRMPYKPAYGPQSTTWPIADYKYSMHNTTLTPSDGTEPWKLLLLRDAGEQACPASLEDPALPAYLKTLKALGGSDAERAHRRTLAEILEGKYDPPHDRDGASDTGMVARMDAARIASALFSLRDQLGDRGLRSGLAHSKLLNSSNELQTMLPAIERVKRAFGVGTDSADCPQDTNANHIFRFD